MATKSIHKGIARDDAFNRQIAKMADAIDALDDLRKGYDEDGQMPVNSQLFNLRHAIQNLTYVADEMEALQKRLREKK